MPRPFKAYGDGETSVFDAWVEADRGGEVARREQDRGEFAESWVRDLWRMGKAEGWLA